MPAPASVPPNDTNDDPSFEALLKPLQEVLTRVWDIALTQCLEGYLEHIRLQEDAATPFMNFIQAAVVVQNSATCYCKRVDSVHNGCRQFVEQLLNFERIEEDKGDENGAVQKRKKVQKSLQSDAFEKLSIGDLISDHNINIRPCKQQKSSDKKKLILNKYVKTTSKPGTSVTVYQTKGSEMGFKHDFRLHWSISSTGLLCEDFDYNSPKVFVSFVYSEHDSIIVPEVIRDHVMDNEIPMDIGCADASTHDDFSPAPSPFQPESPSIAPAPVEPPAPSKKVKDLKKLQYDFFIPLILSCKKKTFNIPQDIIDDVDNSLSKWKKRKLDASSAEGCRSAFDVNFNFNKYYELTVLPDYKVQSTLRLRKKKLFLRRMANAKALENAGKDFNTDFPGFDEAMDDGMDGDDNDSEDIGLLPPAEPLSQEVTSTYEQDIARTMQQYQKGKRDNAKELTEVAKRVAAWHESLQGVLEQAESRSQFNIHRYGSAILEKFPENSENKVVDFASLVRGESKAEISRYLLSTLMLANTYNVEISTSQTGDLVKDCLQLKLLSRVRHHEEMDEEMENIRH